MSGKTPDETDQAQCEPRVLQQRHKFLILLTALYRNMAPLVIKGMMPITTLEVSMLIHDVAPEEARPETTMVI